MTTNVLITREYPKARIETIADPLRDPTDVADQLGMSRINARRLMLDGTLPVVLIRTRMFVRQSVLDAYLANGAVKRDRAS